MSRPAKPLDPSTYAGQVGAIMRRLRERRKLSVADAAAAAGVAAPTWYHWESGERSALDRLPDVARALGCQPRALLP